MGGKCGAGTCGARRAVWLECRGRSTGASNPGTCRRVRDKTRHASRQRPPTIAAGAGRRQSLHRLHVAHPVQDLCVCGAAVPREMMVGRAGGTASAALVAAVPQVSSIGVLGEAHIHPVVVIPILARQPWRRGPRVLLRAFATLAPSTATLTRAVIAGVSPARTGRLLLRRGLHWRRVHGPQELLRL
jgi:hypothetical protein